MRFFLCSIIAVLAHADLLTLLSGKDKVKGVEALTKATATLLDVSISSAAATTTGVSSLSEFLCAEWDVLTDTVAKPVINANCKSAFSTFKKSVGEAKDSVEKQTLIALVKMLTKGGGLESAAPFEQESSVPNFPSHYSPEYPVQSHEFALHESFPSYQGNGYSNPVGVDSFPIGQSGYSTHFGM